MTADEIKKLSKQLVREYTTMPLKAWTAKVFDCISKLDINSSSLLWDLTQLYFDFTYGVYDEEQARNLSNGYLAWFKEVE